MGQTDNLLTIYGKFIPETHTQFSRWCYIEDSQISRLKTMIKQNDIEDRAYTPISAKNGEGTANMKIIGAVVTVLLLCIAAFAYKDIKTSRILVLNAYDVSDSGRKHLDVQEKHCKISQRNQKIGDNFVLVGFAERAEVVNGHKIENQLDFTPCNINLSNFGKSNGTSVLNLFHLARTEVRGYRQRGIEDPLVFSIILDAAEPVPGEAPFNDQSLQEVKAIADELTKNGHIRIIGPSTTLQQKLKEALAEANPKIEVCSYLNFKTCTDNAIDKARQ